jgi:hypothetical protein
MTYLSMRKLILAIGLWLAPVYALGQGATALFPAAVNQNGGGLPFATITFCSTPTTVNSLGVCQTPVTVFKDQGLTLPYGAIQTDGIGYFPPNANTATSLWFAAGTYCYTVTTTNMQSPATNPCTPFSVAVTPGSSPSFAGLTVTGPATVGTLGAGATNGSCYVGEPTSSPKYSTIAAALADSTCIQ